MADMKEKRIAHCIPHTHWDPFWYFTAQDSMVVFAYNVKEMIRAFDSGEIEHFFLDGQTVAMDEYLQIHPEDKEKITSLVKSGKLVLGPFNSQLDPFITCGESVVSNLQIGMENADALGGSGKTAYLADPFGQTIDFPKIFNQMDIHDFVFTRGVNDRYGLDIDFLFRSNDGSQVNAHTLLAGYGYGCYAFKDGTLFSKDAKDYNQLDVQALIDRLVERSALKNEFVFPLGFDQNPIMKGIRQRMAEYNDKYPDYEFKLTSWKDYFDHVRASGVPMKTCDHEILGGQYHRIHISGMNSCRSDIKTIQDEAERILTYEAQPLMTLADSVGIPFDRNLLKNAWYTLVNCQTHASATHIDETNAWIKNNSKVARSTANAIKVYLSRLIAESIPKKDGEYPLTVFNTTPWKEEKVVPLTIITRLPAFEIRKGDKVLPYVLVSQFRENADVVRKDRSRMDPEKCFYKTEVLVPLGEFEGISYQTFHIVEGQGGPVQVTESSPEPVIENEFYKITYTGGRLDLYDKKRERLYEGFLYLEDGGDAGDTYDYDYPDDDWILYDRFENAHWQVEVSHLRSQLRLNGALLLPADLEERNRRVRSVVNEYEMVLTLDAGSGMLNVKGTISNKSRDHRLRIAFKTGTDNEKSYAGTQYGYVLRDTVDPDMAVWKEQNFFEEPSSTKPLLNHVSSVSEDGVWTLFTRSLKEYDFIGDGHQDIAATILRSCGYVGLPDLNRRPGRPSGLSNKILPAPEAQMLMDVMFDLNWKHYDAFDPNVTANDYVRQAIDPVYYENQRLDKTIHPLSYFPINPWETEIPEDHVLLHVENKESAFGTLTETRDQDAYVLRMYNAGNEAVSNDELVVEASHGDMSVCDLQGNIMEGRDPLEDMRPGELRNYHIEKR